MATERREAKTDKEQSYRSEVRYGVFERSVTLPAGATDPNRSRLTGGE